MSYPPYTEDQLVPSEFPKVTDFERICEIIWPQNLNFGIFQVIWY